MQKNSPNKTTDLTVNFILAAETMFKMWQGPIKSLSFHHLQIPV